MLLPKIAQIETVATACTARCIMCPIETWTRPVATMKLDLFAIIVEKLAPYASSIEYCALQGCGEPLLDKNIAAKVALARRHALRGIHLVTNATELTEATGRALLDSGIHRMVFSIDGITRETHEAIRLRTSYDEIVAQVHRFIALRDLGGHATEIWLRMIVQPRNAHEWDAYEAYWRRHIDTLRGDRVVYFPVHNWAGNPDVDRAIAGEEPRRRVTWCEDLWQRIYIHCSGAIALCCVDDNGWFDIGNIRDVDPVEILNTAPVFRHHRELMASGRIGELEHCRNCLVPLSRERTNYRGPVGG